MINSLPNHGQCMYSSVFLAFSFGVKRDNIFKKNSNFSPIFSNCLELLNERLLKLLFILKLPNCRTSAEKFDC